MLIFQGVPSHMEPQGNGRQTMRIHLYTREFQGRAFPNSVCEKQLLRKKPPTMPLFSQKKVSFRKKKNMPHKIHVWYIYVHILIFTIQNNHSL